MNSFSVIYDAVRKLPFALAFKKDNQITFFGVNSLGESWAKEMNEKRLNACCWDIPTGMARSAYKSFNKEDESLLIKSFNISEEQIRTKNLPVNNLGNKENIKYEPTIGAKSFMERHLLANGKTKIKSSLLGNLSQHGSKNKQTNLEYKAKTFTTNMKVSSFVNLIRVKNLGFDSKTNLFKNKPSNALSDFSVQKTIEDVGFGVLRRFGRKNLNQQDYSLVNRRVSRRANSLAEIATEDKKSFNFAQKKNNLIYVNTRFTDDVEVKGYTKPELRENIKRRIMAGSNGGKPGQWSARKAQLVAQAYEKAGGGYTGKKTKTQRSLSKWTDEDWTTSDGKPAIRKGGTTRYLPKKAWRKLTPAQKAATNRKKREGSKKGRQFVANTGAAERAGRNARKKDVS